MWWCCRGCVACGRSLTLALARAPLVKPLALKQPNSSLTLDSSPDQSMEEETKATRAYRDQCRDSAPWRRSTCFTMNDPQVVAINGSCPSDRTTYFCKDGTVKECRGQRSILRDGQVSLGFACYRCVGVTLPRRSGTRLAMIGEEVLGQMLANYRFSRPLNGSATSPVWSTTQVAASVSSGVQPSRQGLPQRIPESFTPEMHISLAQKIARCFCCSSISAHTAKALAEQQPDAAALSRKHPRRLSCWPRGERRRTTWFFRSCTLGYDRCCNWVA